MTLRSFAVQRTMSIDEIMALNSRDYPGKLVSEIWDMMHGTYCYHEGHCHEYVYALRDDMLAHGYDGPPICVDVGLRNGHHRAHAARLAGLDRVPITADWDSSRDSHDYNTDW